MKSQTIINIAFAAAFAGWVVWSRNPALGVVTCKELRVVDSAGNARIELKLQGKENAADQEEFAQVIMWSQGLRTSSDANLGLYLSKDRTPSILFSDGRGVNELSGEVQIIKTFTWENTGWDEKSIAEYTKHKQEQERQNKEFK